MSKRKNKRIVQKKEYKKEKALLLLAYSFFKEVFIRLGSEPKIEDVNNDKDLILYKTYRWLKMIHRTFATLKIKGFVDKRMGVMVNKYYSDNEKPMYEDILNIALLNMYLFLAFNKHNNIKIFNSPVTEDEILDFLNWYNDENEMDKEALLFMYRLALSIDPTKKSVIHLKSLYNKLFGDVTFEEIVNENI